ncbi:MAG: family 20 glycosylhydrolase [Bacteroidales bacterium]|nr:family 20 glycosylhydrolase [Bacteroidales bacterium]
MKSRHMIMLIMAAIFFSHCKPPSPDDINIIPQPANAFVIPGSFTITSDTRIITQMENDEVVGVCEYLNDILETSAGYRLAIIDDEEVNSFSGDVVITTFNADTAWDEERYDLRVQGGSSVVLQANSARGLFYGVQTILQALPPEVLSKSRVEEIDLEMPAMNVFDYPRFKWRGMHLDVGRHFFSVEFIKKYIDMMALYKMNMFHWHLTEDQGWRIEIKKYPGLTEVGAYRTEPDGSVYGGYYTQEDIREIVAYAAARHISIVPEIEMPGHCMAALAAYPELSCTGGPFEVASLWGVKNDVFCAGNEKTFEFLENVLLEVMDLFPGEYIHIGGDEVPKDRWEECRKCQARIRNEGLAGEAELQSWFIKRMERFLSEHGRKLIGWDEILEGGLAPEATVMSWRGEEGGIAAAQMGHDVVMTPNSHCYFDYYQADPATQPRAIGGLITLKDVYHYNPVSKELNEAEQQRILGVQGNLWTEYIATHEYAEYMAVPRMLALAEVAWSRNDRIRWERFLRKLDHHFSILDVMEVNYCDAVYAVDIKAVFDSSTRALSLRMSSDIPDAVIWYTLDGSEPGENATLYDTIFALDHSAKVKARLKVNGELKGHISEKEFLIHKAAGKVPDYTNKYSPKYTAGGSLGLVDGIRGSIHYSDGHWQGFSGEDVEVIIDLGEEMTINSISTAFMQNITSWIFLPSTVNFMVANQVDGPWESAGKFINSVPQENKETMVKNFSRKLNGINARYIKIAAKNPGLCPEWHPGAGNPGWVFIDEIVVE